MENWDSSDSLINYMSGPRGFARPPPTRAVEFAEESSKSPHTPHPTSGVGRGYSMIDNAFWKPNWAPGGVARRALGENIHDIWASVLTDSHGSILTEYFRR